MPLFGRRRPLMRAAMVGGAGYVAGKHMQQGRDHEAEQDEQIAETQQQTAPVAPAAPPAAAPAGGGAAAGQVEALTQLKGLLDSGVLTQAEFDAQKQKILAGE